jgi:hypothetical protein
MLSGRIELERRLLSKSRRSENSDYKGLLSTIFFFYFYPLLGYIGVKLDIVSTLL